MIVHEVVLQVRLFEICYNSHENSNYVLILKTDKHLYMSINE